MDFSIEKIFYQYSNGKIYDLTDIIEYLILFKKACNVKNILCLQCQNSQVLFSGCISIINDQIIKFNESELLKNWKSIYSSLENDEKINISRLNKCIANGDLQYILGIHKVIKLYDNKPCDKNDIIGIIITDNVDIDVDLLGRFKKAISSILKISIQTYSQQTNLKKDHIRKLIKEYDHKNSKIYFSNNYDDIKLSQVLGVALKYSESNAGSIYMHNQFTDELELACYFGDTVPPDKFDFKKKKKSVIAHCYSINRNFIINDISKINLFYENIEYYPAFSNTKNKSIISELAIPIRYATAFTTEIKGVLNLETKNKEFTKNHIEIIQYEIVGKLLLVNELIAQSKAIYNLLGNINKYSQDIECNNVNQFERIKLIINNSLKYAVENTPAFSASFRYHNPIDDSLIKFDSYGKETEDGKNIEKIYVKQFKASVGANVFYYGQERYIKNVNFYLDRRNINKFPDLETPAIVRKDLKSELCIPIFQLKRVVATINFESNVNDAFSAHLDFLRGIAKLIELNLYLDSSIIEHQTLKEKTRVYYDLHDLMATLPNIISSIDETEKYNDLLKNKSFGLHEIFNKITKLTDYYKTKNIGLIKGDQTIGNIVYEVLSKYQLNGYAVINSKNDFRLDNKTAENTFMIIDNILSNIQKNSQYNKIYITYNKLRYRYSNYIRISFGSKTKFSIPEDEINKLYNLPIIKDNKMRLGAFVAGCLAREISGVLYIGDEYKNELYLRSILEIPFSMECIHEL